MKRLPLGLIAALALASPALAQSDPAPSDSPEALDAKVEKRVEQTKKVYGAPDPRKRCRQEPGSDEIVVCVDRGEDQRFEPESRYDANTLEGRRALNNGVPRAPDMDTLDCRKHPKLVCIQGGWAPPPVYYTDVTKLPEAPPGSDADKIAKGEMPEP